MEYTLSFTDQDVANFKATNVSADRFAELAADLRASLEAFYQKYFQKGLYPEFLKPLAHLDRAIKKKEPLRNKSVGEHAETISRQINEKFTSAMKAKWEARGAASGAASAGLVAVLGSVPRYFELKEQETLRLKCLKNQKNKENVDIAGEYFVFTPDCSVELKNFELLTNPSIAEKNLFLCDVLADAEKTVDKRLAPEPGSIDCQMSPNSYALNTKIGDETYKQKWIYQGGQLEAVELSDQVGKTWDQEKPYLFRINMSSRQAISSINSSSIDADSKFSPTSKRFDVADESYRKMRANPEDKSICNATPMGRQIVEQVYSKSHLCLLGQSIRTIDRFKYNIESFCPQNPTSGTSNPRKFTP